MLNMSSALQSLERIKDIVMLMGLTVVLYANMRSLQVFLMERCITLTWEWWGKGDRFRVYTPEIAGAVTLPIEDVEGACSYIFETLNNSSWDYTSSV